MLKHGRFMQNLVVRPVFPKMLEMAPEDVDIDNKSDQSD